MKEETKSKLRKFGKVTAYGFGLFAMLLLGMGLGNCSAKDKPVNASAETALAFDEQNALRPKRALDPADYPTLDPVEGNLLFNAYAGHYALRDEGTYYSAHFNAEYDMYYLPVTQGLYVFDFYAPAGSSGWAGSAMTLNESGSSSFYNLLTSPSYQPAFNLAPSERLSVRALMRESPQRYVMDASASVFGFAFQVFAGARISVSLYDWQTAPAVASFDFPVLFNPYPLGGSPASGDFIFNGPSISGATTQTLYINGLSFRSNGKLYNRVMLTYTHDTDQPFGHYDASGNFVNEGTLGANAWYFRQMVYLYGTDYADVVWNAKYENFDSNMAWKPSLVSGGLWVSQDYRHIEVLSFGGASFQGLPSTSLVAGSSVESVLKLISSYVAPSTSEMGNPFTLIREGFSSVGGILQIQILPFMTLGTLIFVPLVVLVILAILKLLAK